MNKLSITISSEVAAALKPTQNDAFNTVSHIFQCRSIRGSKKKKEWCFVWVHESVETVLLWALEEKKDAIGSTMNITQIFFNEQS